MWRVLKWESGPWGLPTNLVWLVLLATLVSCLQKSLKKKWGGGKQPSSVERRWRCWLKCSTIAQKFACWCAKNQLGGVPLSWHYAMTVTIIQYHLVAIFHAHDWLWGNITSLGHRWRLDTGGIFVSKLCLNKFRLTNGHKWKWMPNNDHDGVRLHSITRE